VIVSFNSSVTTHVGDSDMKFAKKKRKMIMRRRGRTKRRKQNKSNKRAKMLNFPSFQLEKLLVYLSSQLEEEEEGNMLGSSYEYHNYPNS
jgi:hypothetical protein